MKSIGEKIKQLPFAQQKEVEDFVDFLINKNVTKNKKKPKLHWIGGLKEYREKYTSLELQKKALEWRREPSEII